MTAIPKFRINDPAFGSYGRLIFPVDIQIDNSLELEDVEEILPWYSEVNPDKTVEIANYMKNQAARDEQIFYDIYTDEEKAADPEKEETGLFWRSRREVCCFKCRRRIYVCCRNAG